MTQKVFLDGRMISYVTMEYYMLNKPSGVLTATMDKNAKTVLDLMDVKRKDLFLSDDLIKIQKVFCL